MKKRVLSFLMALCMLVSVLPTALATEIAGKADAKAFTDVSESDWFYPYVQFVYEEGLMTGTSDTTFSPKSTLDRAMVVQILYSYEGKPVVSGENAFSDVAQGTWYYDAVQWASANGVTSGDGKGHFNPKKKVSREEFAQFLYAYTGKPAVSGSLGKFPDGGNASGWAKDALLWATQNGVLSGTKTANGVMLNPKGTATRAEAAAMLKSFVGSNVTVSFESNGGSAVSSVQVQRGTTVSRPENPTRSGWVLLGWYNDEECSSAFLFDEEPVKKDITLYADWIEDDADSAAAAYAARQIVIGYQDGDYADSVTGNISLPTSVEQADGVVVSWSSSAPDVIAADGTVVRPDAQDVQVTLTATAEKGGKKQTVSFDLIVLHKNTRNIEEIPNHSVVDIQSMNDSQADIIYNDDETQVVSIEGNFTDLTVNNVDDALDAIQSVHSILGLANAREEMQPLSISRDEYGAEYTFDQVYQGYPVYGLRVTVSADETGVTDSLSAGVCASTKLADVSLTPEVTQEEAEAAAVQQYGGDCAADSGATEQMIYALGAHEDAPVLVYAVRVSGQDSTGSYVDETVFVNAADGSIVFSDTNRMDAESKTGSGKNEIGTKVSFPVAFTWTDFFFFYMQDLERNIQMYTQKLFIDFRIGSEFNSWGDKAAVSAYTNMIQVYDWYQSTLNRTSVDNRGKKLDVLVHDDSMNDNAYWDGSGIAFCDNKSISSSTTPASSLDIVGHEYTHGVFEYTAGDLPYNNTITGAINEGYADVFGCLIEGDWQIGENWLSGQDYTNYGRDAADPTAHRAPDKMSSSFYAQNEEEHTNSALVYHAAYLMEHYGMSKSTLARLWYKSMSMGYDANAEFYTVRRNVLKAAKKMNLSSSEIQIIKRAFDEEEIYDKGTVTGTVTNVEGNAVRGAEVSAYLGGEQIGQTTTGSDGTYTLELDSDTYVLHVNATGYVEYTASQEITRNTTSVRDVVLVKAGNGLVSGTVVSATSGQALSGVQVNVRSGYSNKDGMVIANTSTDDSGTYSLELEAGYYTFEMSLENYTSSYTDVLVQGGETAAINGSLSPVLSGDSYRVVLTWGSSPSDLDSHLAGTAGDGTSFHVYYSNKSAYDTSGAEIANLDLDDTTSYGPETITFKADTDGSYNYYVYRYSSSGSLPASGANVKVYNGDNLIGDYNIDPTASEDNRYWNVFEIQNGIFRTVNTVTSSAHTLSSTKSAVKAVDENAPKA